jgi:hypothetical protein
MEAFLLALVNGDRELVMGVGHATWGVIEGTKRGRNVIRLYPKNGVLQVSNLIPGSKPGDYGEHVVLGFKGEWSLSSRRVEPTRTISPGVRRTHSPTWPVAGSAQGPRDAKPR